MRAGPRRTRGSGTVGDGAVTLHGHGIGDRLVLNEGHLFAVLTPSGEAPEEGAFGLLYRDTRFVSTYRLALDGGAEALSVLRAVPTAPYACRIFMANAGGSGPARRPSHTLGIDRTVVVDGHLFVDEFRFTNYAPDPVRFAWQVRLRSDFRDIMAIRGMASPPCGRLAGARRLREDPPAWALGYDGEDGMRRHLVAALWPRARVEADEAGGLVTTWELALSPGQSTRAAVCLFPHEGEPPPPPPGAEFLERAAAQTAARLEQSYRAWRQAMPAVEVGDETLARLLERSAEDLRALVSDFGEGPFPVAGIPWFAAPFGRDSLWTAYFVLPYAPHLARGVLKTLARYQAQRAEDATDAEPGKILHELRFGEAARLGLIPHRPYYGSIDATPLFAALAADYTLATGDRETFEALEPAVWRAVEWMERYGDPDGDGFLEYRRRAPGGLDNQGWKDSWDSTWHADGTLAPPPIAPVEAQAYVYRALRSLARVMAWLGRGRPAEELDRKATALAQRFDSAFWLEREGFYAHALDGARRPLAVVTSNPGHALWAGIVPPGRAGAVARRLLAPEMFTGYGLRTVAAGQARYNPMSYHNGSVWPHDTAIAAAGLARYGRLEEAARLLRGLLDASVHFEGWRLPELFCGFDRAEGPPVPYPTACSPQAWAAAAPFFMLSTLVGLEVEGCSGQVRARPMVPAWLGEVELAGVRAGPAAVRVRVRPRGARAQDAGSLVEAEVEIRPQEG